MRKPASGIGWTICKRDTIRFCSVFLVLKNFWKIEHNYVYVCVEGKVSKLTVITTNAGAGTLAVHIEGPSKLAIVCTELDDGYEFTYTPMAAGNYMIIIKYCSVTIAGCPFKAVVTGRRPYGNPPWFFLR